MKKGYISKDELGFIRKNYSEEKVKQLRKCFFTEITEADKKQFGDKENIRILRKLFIPEYDAVNGEIYDNPDTINRVEPLGFDLETLSLVVKAQVKAKDTISNTFDALEGKSYGATPQSLMQINLTTDSKLNAQAIYDRATALRIIQSGLQSLVEIAETVEETPEEKAIKRAKDSTK